MNLKRVNPRVLLLTGVLVLFFLGLWETSISAAPVSEPPFVLTIKDNHLSAKIETVSLRKVLEKLSQLTDIEVSLDGSVQEELVSVEYENLPVAEGIQRILQGKSYALTYAQISLSNGHAALPKLIGITVIPKSAGPSIDNESINSVAYRSGSNARESLSNSFKARTKEVSASSESETVSGLQDQDPKVREAALKQLGQSGQPVPVEPLAEMALTDTSPQLRMEALDLLAAVGGDATLDPLKQALRDSDPRVRGLAQGLLAGPRVSAQVLLEGLKEESR